MVLNGNGAWVGSTSSVFSLPASGNIRVGTGGAGQAMA